MKNMVQAGVNLTLPAPNDVLSGDGVVIGAIAGVAAIDALSGESVDVVTEGVFEMPKVAADAFEIGDVVHFDTITKLVTADATDPKIGVAVTVGAIDDATVAVRLVPSI